MKLKITFIFTSMLTVLLLVAISPSAAQAQPNITLPPEESPRAPDQAAPDQPQPGIRRPSLLQLPRESQIEVPLDQTGVSGATAIGGYGELTFNAPSNGPNV